MYPPDGGIPSFRVFFFWLCPRILGTRCRQRPSHRPPVFVWNDLHCMRRIYLFCLVAQKAPTLGCHGRERRESGDTVDLDNDCTTIAASLHALARLCGSSAFWEGKAKGKRDSLEPLCPQV